MLACLIPKRHFLRLVEGLLRHLKVPSSEQQRETHLTSPVATNFSPSLFILLCERTDLKPEPFIAKVQYDRLALR